MSSTVDISKSPGVKLHEATYTHDNLPTTAEKAKLPYIANVTSDIQTQLNSLGSSISAIPASLPFVAPDLQFDFSNDPAGGILTNSGNLGTAFNYAITGSWTRSQASGGAYIYTKADANLGGFTLPIPYSHLTSGFSLTSLNQNNNQAEVVITDASHDLQALFSGSTKTNVIRRYKIALWETVNNRLITGYIGAITKNGNAYTIPVYLTPCGTVKSWNYVGNNLGANPVAGLVITPLFNSFEHGTATAVWDSTVPAPGGFTLSFWYYCVDSTTDYITFASRWDDWIANKLNQGWLLYQAATNDTLAYSQRRETDGAQTDITASLFVSGKWHHVIVRHSSISGDTVLRFYINGKPAYTTGYQGWIGSTWRPMAFCMSHPSPGAAWGNPFPQGAKIAKLRYWDWPIHESMIPTIHHCDRIEMGLSYNMV